MEATNPQDNRGIGGWFEDRAGDVGRSAENLGSRVDAARQAYEQGDYGQAALQTGGAALGVAGDVAGGTLNALGQVGEAVRRPFIAAQEIRNPGVPMFDDPTLNKNPLGMIGQLGMEAGAKLGQQVVREGPQAALDTLGDAVGTRRVMSSNPFGELAASIVLDPLLPLAPGQLSKIGTAGKVADQAIFAPFNAAQKFGGPLGGTIFGVSLVTSGAMQTVNPESAGLVSNLPGVGPLYTQLRNAVPAENRGALDFGSNLLVGIAAGLVLSKARVPGFTTPVLATAAREANGKRGPVQEGDLVARARTLDAPTKGSVVNEGARYLENFTDTMWQASDGNPTTFQPAMANLVVAFRQGASPDALAKVAADNGINLPAESFAAPQNRAALGLIARSVEGFIGERLDSPNVPRMVIGAKGEAGGNAVPIIEPVNKARAFFDTLYKLNGEDPATTAQILASRAVQQLRADIGRTTPDWKNPVSRYFATVRQLNDLPKDNPVSQPGTELAMRMRRGLGEYLVPDSPAFRDVVAALSEDATPLQRAQMVTKLDQVLGDAERVSRQLGYNKGDGPSVPALDPKMRRDNDNWMMRLATDSKILISPLWLTSRPQYWVNNAITNAVISSIGTQGRVFGAFGQRGVDGYEARRGVGTSERLPSWVNQGLRADLAGEGNDTLFVGMARRAAARNATIGAPGRAVGGIGSAIGDATKNFRQIFTESTWRKATYIAEHNRIFDEQVKTLATNRAASLGLTGDEAVAFTKAMQVAAIEGKVPNPTAWYAATDPSLLPAMERDIIMRIARDNPDVAAFRAAVQAHYDAVLAGSRTALEGFPDSVTPKPNEAPPVAGAPASESPVAPGANTAAGFRKAAGIETPPATAVPPMGTTRMPAAATTAPLVTPRSSVPVDPNAAVTPRRDVDTLTGLPEWMREKVKQDYAVAERLGVVAQIEKMAADGLTAKQIVEQLPSLLASKATTLMRSRDWGAIQDAANLVRAVRTVHGIPSLVDTPAVGLVGPGGTTISPEFIAWRNQYRAALANRNASQVISSSAPNIPIAPASTATPSVATPPRQQTGTYRPENLPDAPERDLIGAPDASKPIPLTTIRDLVADTRGTLYTVPTDVNAGPYNAIASQLQQASSEAQAAKQAAVDHLRSGNRGPAWSNERSRLESAAKAANQKLRGLQTALNEIPPPRAYSDFELQSGAVADPIAREITVKVGGQDIQVGMTDLVAREYDRLGQAFKGATARKMQMELLGLNQTLKTGALVTDGTGRVGEVVRQNLRGTWRSEVVPLDRNATEVMTDVRSARLIPGEGVTILSDVPNFVRSRADLVIDDLGYLPAGPKGVNTVDPALQPRPMASGEPFKPADIDAIRADLQALGDVRVVSVNGAEVFDIGGLAKATGPYPTLAGPLNRIQGIPSSSGRDLGTLTKIRRNVAAMVSESSGFNGGRAFKGNEAVVRMLNKAVADGDTVTLEKIRIWARVMNRVTEDYAVVPLPYPLTRNGKPNLKADRPYALVSRDSVPELQRILKEQGDQSYVAAIGDTTGNTFRVSDTAPVGVPRTSPQPVAAPVTTPRFGNPRAPFTPDTQGFGSEQLGQPDRSVGNRQTTPAIDPQSIIENAGLTDQIPPTGKAQQSRMTDTNAAMLELKPLMDEITAARAQLEAAGIDLSVQARGWADPLGGPRNPNFSPESTAALNRYNQAMSAFDDAKARIREKAESIGRPDPTVPTIGDDAARAILRQMTFKDGTPFDSVLDDINPADSYARYIGGILQNVDAYAASAGPRPNRVPTMQDLAAVRNGAGDIATRQALDNARGILFPYDNKNYGDYLMSHAMPYSYWILRHMAQSGRYLAQHPGQYAALMSVVNQWYKETEGLSPGQRWTVFVGTMPDGTEVRFRPAALLPFATGSILEVANPTNKASSDWFVELQQMTGFGASLLPQYEIGRQLAATKGANLGPLQGLLPDGAKESRARDILSQSRILRQVTQGAVDLEGGRLFGLQYPSFREAVYGTNQIGIENWYTGIELAAMVKRGEITDLDAKRALLSQKENKPNDLYTRAQQTALGEQGYWSSARFFGLPIGGLSPERQRIDGLNDQYGALVDAGVDSKSRSAFTKQAPDLAVSWAGNDDPRMLALSIANDDYRKSKEQIDARYQADFKRISDDLTAKRINGGNWLDQRNYLYDMRQKEYDALLAANPNADPDGSKRKAIEDTLPKGIEYPQSDAAKRQEAIEDRQRVVLDGYYGITTAKFTGPDGEIDFAGYKAARDSYLAGLTTAERTALLAGAKKNQTEADKWYEANITPLGEKYGAIPKYAGNPSPETTKVWDTARSVYQDARYGDDGKDRGHATGLAALSKAGISQATWSKAQDNRNPARSAFYNSKEMAPYRAFYNGGTSGQGASTSTTQQGSAGASNSNARSNGTGNSAGNSTSGSSFRGTNNRTDWDVEPIAKGIDGQPFSVRQFWQESELLRSRGQTNDANRQLAQNWQALVAAGVKLTGEPPKFRTEPQEKAYQERTAILDEYGKLKNKNAQQASAFYSKNADKLDALSAVISGKPQAPKSPFYDREPFARRSGGGSIRPGPQPNKLPFTPRPPVQDTSEFARLTREAGEGVVSALLRFTGGKGPMPSRDNLDRLRKKYPLGLPRTATLEAWIALYAGLLNRQNAA